MCVVAEAAVRIKPAAAGGEKPGVSGTPPPPPAALMVDREEDLPESTYPAAVTLTPPQLAFGRRSICMATARTVDIRYDGAVEGWVG